MFIEKVKTEGLAHLSYVLGSEGEAAVIDPRRDVAGYAEMAAANGCRITRVFETHRNEDLLSGSASLARKTGASVHHGPNAAGEVRYAETVHEGDCFAIGKLELRVLETPGHTDDSLSFAVYDRDFGDEAFGVFTGDTLFVGDVGRTDFYPDRAEEVAGLMFDSLRSIEALGDQAVIYPAHGAGSVCGDAMAAREVSTIGYERSNNPRLRITDRDEFIAAKLAEQHETPPYFRYMERGNLAGADDVQGSLRPPALSAPAVKELGNDVVFVDVRSPSAFLGAHLPQSLSLPEDMISAFAGWFLEPDDSILLVADGPEQAADAAMHLARIGYDNVRGFVGPNLVAWAASGGDFNTIRVVDTDEVAERLVNAPADWTLLDVRSEREIEDDRIEPSTAVPIGELPRRMGELDAAGAFTVMCGSGARATVAASLLLRGGFARVDLFLGSLAAWKQEGLETSNAA